MRYQEVKELMIERLSNDLPDELHYHGVHHTLDVLNEPYCVLRLFFMTADF